MHEDGRCGWAIRYCMLEREEKRCKDDEEYRVYIKSFTTNRASPQRQRNRASFHPRDTLHEARSATDTPSGLCLVACTTSYGICTSASHRAKAPLSVPQHQHHAAPYPFSVHNVEVKRCERLSFLVGRERCGRGRFRPC